MKHTKGFSLIELLIVVAIILVISAIAIPNLLRSRMAAHDAAAASTLRNINNSQAAFIAEFGSSIGYADTMLRLGPGVPCDQTHACLVDDVLACASEPCIKSGFGFFLTSSAAGTLPVSDYTATATPISMGQSGQFNFCGTDDGVVRQEIVPSTTLGTALTHTQCTDPAKYLALSK